MFVELLTKNNFLIRTFLGSNVGVINMIRYIPEILYICSRDSRGLQILKETKIYYLIIGGKDG